MKLIIPHLSEIEAADARLIRLAEFLGITCEPLFLGNQAHLNVNYIKEFSLNRGNCFVVNPQVMKQWTGGHLPRHFVDALKSQFPFLLVHRLTQDSFCQDLTRALSSDRLQYVEAVADTGKSYEISSDMKAVCGPFSGLSFGPANPCNDHVFSVINDDAIVRTPISIGGKPFMATMKQDKTELLFLASTDVMDVDSEVGDTPLSEYFSRFVPHAMALRYIFGDQCWHPNELCASFIVDDPLLRLKYGYLNFETLLKLTKECNFSTTIAFIPHNYRRNLRQTVQMFRQNNDRLAICYHGNDHTAAEFASPDLVQLNTMTRIAEFRMRAHEKMTGLCCDRVMVFPQERFSVEAMKVLKSRNFFAAVSGGPHPAGCRVSLTLAEIAQPAVLRHSGFALFLRKYIGQAERLDFAFNLFFGRPVLIVDHHEIFARTETLIDTVSMINSMAPDIKWCNLATAITSSNLRRTASDGTCHVHAYSSAVPIFNKGNSPKRFVVEWNHPEGSPPVERVMQDEAFDHTFQVSASAVRLSTEFVPGESHTFSVEYRNDYPSLRGLGFRWEAKAFLRRRLSEARDNYISKNRFAMAVCQALRRRVLSKVL